MNSSRLEKICIILLLIIFGGIVLHAPLSVILGTVFPKYDLLIKAWKEILMIIIALLMIAAISKRKVWIELLNDWLIRLLGMYIVLTLLLGGLFHNGLQETIAGLAIDLRFIIFCGLTYVLMKILPQYRRSMLVVGTIGACIVVVFATMQLFLPADILSHIGYNKNTIAPYLTVDKNPNYIRVNSTLRGPNPLGAYAGMILAFLVAAFVKSKISLSRYSPRFLFASGLTICSVIALWISYSRSALVGAILAVSIVVLVSSVRKIPKRLLLVVATVIVTFVGAGLMFSKGNVVSNVILHENPAGGSAVSSNAGHISSLRDGIDGLIKAPFGNGIGSAGSASLLGNKPVIVEDQYLLIAHEAGWIGLALFVALYVYVLVRLYKKRNNWLALGAFASGVGLGVIGLLLPVWVDDTVSIVWWGLVAIALVEEKGGENDRKQIK